MMIRFNDTYLIFNSCRVHHLVYRWSFSGALSSDPPPLPLTGPGILIVGWQKEVGGSPQITPVTPGQSATRLTDGLKYNSAINELQ